MDLSDFEKGRADLRKLQILVELREAANLTQDKAGALLGLEGAKRRDSVRAWETGTSCPALKRRPDFIVYLLDGLRLRNDLKRFLQVWDDIMVGEWGWRPLSEEEWRHNLPGRELPQVATPARPSLYRAVEQATSAVAPVLTSPVNLPADLPDLTGREAEIAAVRERLARQGSEIGDRRGERWFTRRSEAPAPMQHNLPAPGRVRFVNRESELKKLDELLSPANPCSLINIFGIDGVGKTTLALVVGHRYRHNVTDAPQHSTSTFDAIIWTAAKATDFSELGGVQQKAQAHSLDDIVKAIGTVLDRDDIVNDPSTDQEERALRALAAQSTLLIVANVDALEDPRVRDFLHKVRSPTKVIVTSTHSWFFGDDRVEVEPFCSEHATKLVEQECEAQSVALSDVERQKLCQVTQGIPLAIKWGIAQIGFGRPAASVLHSLGQPGGEIAMHCFRDTVHLLRDTPAVPLLHALALFPSEATDEALRSIAGFGEPYQWDEGLRILQRFSLVEEHQGRFALRPLTRAYAQHDVRESGTTERLRNRFVDCFRRFAGDYGTPKNWLGSLPWENMRRISSEHLNLVQSAQWAYELGRWSDCAQFEFQTFMSFGLHGHWNERLEVGRLALAALDHQPRTQHWEEHRARILIDSLGWVHRNRRQFAEMRSVIDEGLAVARSLNPRNPDLEAIAASNLSRAAFEERDLESARLWVEKGLLLQQELHPGTVARLKTMQGRILVDEGDLEGARSRYTEALEIRKKEQTGDLVGFAANMRHLAEIEFRLGNHERAAELYLEAKEMAEQYGNRSNLARIYLSLARIAQVRYRWAESKEFADQALKLFEHLDMQKEVADAQQVIVEVSARGLGGQD
jgi:tetratricopeptide (TPR) repeat protein